MEDADRVEGFGFRQANGRMPGQWSRLVAGLLGNVETPKYPSTREARSSMPAQMKGTPVSSVRKAKTPFLPHVFRPNSFFTDFPPEANPSAFTRLPCRLKLAESSTASSPSRTSKKPFHAEWDAETNGERTPILGQQRQFFKMIEIESANNGPV